MESHENEDIKIDYENITGDEVYINKDQYENIIHQNDIIQEKIDNLNDSIVHLESVLEKSPDLDYTEKFNDLIESMNNFTSKMDSMSELFNIIHSASSAILSYSVFYVPLIFIVVMLWWFFRQFIR